MHLMSIPLRHTEAIFFRHGFVKNETKANWSVNTGSSCWTHSDRFIKSGWLILRNNLSTKKGTFESRKLEMLEKKEESIRNQQRWISKNEFKTSCNIKRCDCVLQYYRTYSLDLLLAVYYHFWIWDQTKNQLYITHQVKRTT